MMGRIVTAVRLYQRLGLPIIVTGGRVFDDGAVAEAPVVKRFLMDLGVPANIIIEENRARRIRCKTPGLLPPFAISRDFPNPSYSPPAYHLKRAGMGLRCHRYSGCSIPRLFSGVQEHPLSLAPPVASGRRPIHLRQCHSRIHGHFLLPDVRIIAGESVDAI